MSYPIPEDAVALLVAAVTAAEADARRQHDEGLCHLSEWSCSHCEVAA